MKHRSCKRSETKVERYKKKLSVCNYLYYDEDNEMKSDIILESNMTWGKNQEIELGFRWLTGASEVYKGHFGDYEPNRGYI